MATTHRQSKPVTIVLNVDETLRKWGYQIHARPRRGPVLWKSREGHILTEEEALARVKRKTPPATPQK